MNNTTLGYSFIDTNELLNTKPADANKILTKLKTKTTTTNDNQPSAFSEDDTKSEMSSINTPVDNIETFNNYDMGESNKRHYTTQVSENNPSNNMLYDFGRHINTPQKQSISSFEHANQEKINYIIHMLEQNRQLRTENITEEMIMYFFLGVFILYISENFVKMGKYSR